MIRSLVIALGIGVAIIGLAQINFGCDWTGFGRCEQRDGVRPEKTLWDWMGLLLVPAVLAGGAYWLNRADKRLELQINEDRAQEATLQTYLDQMTSLLLDKGLRTSQPDDEVRAVARTRTLIALRRLDRQRRITVFRFLIESDLIRADKAIVSLQSARLAHYDLSIADLSATDLSKTDLRGADLRMTKLRGANLRRALLSEANLSGADLNGANLRVALLRDATLSLANLSGADLSGADLSGANLAGAELIGANLGSANLRGAIVEEVYFDSSTIWPDGFVPPADSSGSPY